MVAAPSAFQWTKFTGFTKNRLFEMLWCISIINKLLNLGIINIKKRKLKFKVSFTFPPISLKFKLISPY